MNLLNIQSTKVKWVLDEEQNNLCFALNKLGIKYKRKRISLFSKYNYLSSRFMFDLPLSIPKIPWQKYFIDYYHGGLFQEKIFNKNINNILKHQKSIQKIRVSSSLYKNLLIRKGIHPKKIQLIPIPVNTEIYHPHKDNEILELKRKLKIPENVFLIGSFQKDGIGWGSESQPKLIKGPDIFIDTILLLKKEIKNIFLILTGKSRSYIIKRLNEIGIKYIYLDGDDPKFRSKLYSILDAYLICSREEGGPKGFLESISCNTPVITTNVGQVVDIGKDGYNSFISYSFNPEEISAKFMEFYNLKNTSNLKFNMQKTAKNNSLNELVKKWELFFDEIIIKK